MTTDPHRGCIADARDDAQAAADALEQRHVCIPEVDVLQPANSQYDAWTLEATVQRDGHRVDGWGPPLADTQRCHGLTLVDYQPRSPVAHVAVLTL